MDDSALSARILINFLRLERAKPVWARKGFEAGWNAEAGCRSMEAKSRSPAVAGLCIGAHLDLCRASPKANTTTTFHSAPPEGRYRRHVTS